MRRRHFVSAVGAGPVSLKPSALALASRLAAYQPSRSASDMSDDEDVWFHVRNPITKALDFHASIGAERNAARLRFLRRRWARPLAQLPKVKLLTPDDDAQSCALGAMSMDGIGGPQLVDHLITTHHIHVRARVVPNEFSAIRVTPNVYITVAAVDAFTRAVETVASRGL